MLVGITHAAKFHIRKLDLNHPFFVKKRKKAEQARQLLKNKAICDLNDELRDPLLELLSKMKTDIPHINSLPHA